MSMEEFVRRAEQYVAEGWLSRQEKDNLVQYTYTQECQARAFWNEITLACRGIILDKRTNQVVARPFRKFFNWGENEWSTPDKFPLWNDGIIEITTKIDGSLGIIYKYDYEWCVATKGSFQSEQAVWATNWIKNNWDRAFLDPGRTYLVEIVYPENRIVLKYNEPGLILLAQIDVVTGYEYPRENLEGLGQDLQCPVAPAHTFESIDAMLNKAQTLTHEEGWVIRWVKTNQRVKVKTEWYRKLHRIVSNLSPLALWEKLSPEGTIPDDFWFSIPEEIRPDVEWMKERLEFRWKAMTIEVNDALIRTLTVTGPWPKDPSREEAKRIAAVIMKEPRDWVRACLFARLRDKSWAPIIQDLIRPRANQLEIA